MHLHALFAVTVLHEARPSWPSHLPCTPHTCCMLSSSVASRLLLLCTGIIEPLCMHRCRSTSLCMHCTRDHLDAGAGERCFCCRRRCRRPGGRRRRLADVFLRVRQRCRVGSVLAAAGARGCARQRRRRLPGDPPAVAVLQLIQQRRQQQQQPLSQPLSCLGPPTSP